MDTITERHLTVNDLRTLHPDWTLRQIGTVVGLSRERVRQLLKAAGHATIHKGWGRHRHCSTCGRLKPDSKHRLCFICLPHYLERAPRATRPCSYCKKPITRRVSQWKGSERNPLSSRSNLAFCNKVCHGRWLGTHYGWGRSKPDNTPLTAPM